jgi:predicted NUDIX family NTP pyrophosphohydrolase
MPKLSAGLLLYRQSDGEVEVFLVHPGGPFWKKKDDGAWSIPKGEYEPEEDPVSVALREFQEEVGSPPPVTEAALLELGLVKQPSRKELRVWTAEGDVDATNIKSNMFEMEWPPKSGKREEFPEVDRAGWFVLETAKRKLLSGHVEFLSRLAANLGVSFDPAVAPEQPEGPQQSLFEE